MPKPTVDIEYAITLQGISYRVTSQDRGDTILIRHIDCESTPSPIDFLRVATELGASLSRAWEIGEVSTIYPKPF